MLCPLPLLIDVMAKRMKKAAAAPAMKRMKAMKKAAAAPKKAMKRMKKK